MTNTVTRDELRARDRCRRRRRRDARPAVLRGRPPPGRDQHPADRDRAARAGAAARQSGADRCSNAACRNSEIAAEQLRALGYADVRKYADGKENWREAGLALEHGAAVAA
jgi:rhodanese-related sulfurtransferase